MRRLRGFVISWYYPPGNSSEGLVTYKLLKNSAFEYDVFTRRPVCGSMWDRKTNESELVAKNVHVHQAEHLDAQSWVDEAVEFFKENKDKYDFIMSRVMPVDSHIAASRIKEEFPNMPWIASFGDPLYNSPYIEYVTKGENPYFLKQYMIRERPSLLKSIRLAISPTRFAHKHLWEKGRALKMVWPLLCEQTNESTFSKADLLVFNNKYQYDRAFADEAFNQYKDKGAIINHGFDKTLYPKDNAKSEEGKKRFIYVGHLDEMRNAKPIFEALGRLKRKDRTLAKKVQFDFYGHMSDDDKVAIIDQQIQDVVFVHPDVTYLESLKKISEADWLLLIDANLNSQLNEYIYFPAKLVDYVGAQKPILAVTQVIGTSADAVHELGAGQVVTHSADEVYLYLSKIINQDYSPTEYNQEVVDRYDAKNVAKIFDKKVLELLDE